MTKHVRLLVHIIESLTPDDLEAQRSEGTIIRAGLKLSNVEAAYRVVASKDGLNRALTAFRDARHRDPDAQAVLHLSVHGDKTGIGLTTDRLDWRSLREPIRDACEGTALLCTSSCFGFEGFRMAEFDEKPPFLALVGHRTAVHLDTAAVGYAVFYHRLAKGSPPSEALTAMKQATGDYEFELVPAREAQIKSLAAVLGGLRPGASTAEPPPRADTGEHV
jgi:hypothetical protein